MRENLKIKEGTRLREGHGKLRKKLEKWGKDSEN